MFIFSHVHLRRFCFVFLVRTFIRMVAFTHVCLPTSKWFLFLLCTSIRIVGSLFSCAFSSKCLLLLGWACVKMFTFSRVRLYFCMFALFRVHLHQFYVYLCAPISKNGSYFSCASSSKIFAFSLCAYVKMVPFSRVRLHQNVCFYSGAPALKCFSSAPTSIFACTCVCASQNGFFHSTAPRSKYLHILVCMFWGLASSCTYLLLRQNSCVELCKPTSKCLLLLGCVSIKLLLFVVCANINFFPVVMFAYVKTLAYTCVRLHLTACSYSCPILASFYVIVRMYCCVRCLIL